MIPKLNGPFNVRDARAFVTWVYKDGSPTEHVQSAAAAFLFAACDRIEALERHNAELTSIIVEMREDAEALERENAAMAKVVEAARTYLMFELACCHRDCASHDGDSDCNCGYVAAHDALDELPALAPEIKK